MNFPLEVVVSPTSFPGRPVTNIHIYSPLMFFVGPNGSGKTQLLRALSLSLKTHGDLRGKRIRYLSAGRLGPLEKDRTDFLGNHRGKPDNANENHGSKSHSQFRLASESIQGDFFALSERPEIEIKVGERLRKLFKRSVLIEWDAGRLIINFVHNGVNEKPYTASNEASGLLHFVSILAALYDDEIDVLLIDEPEVSLHPQLQAFILQEIKRVSGNPDNPGKKMIFLATHSPSMIEISKPKDLCSFVFCQQITENPVQISPDTEELKNQGIKELIARMGQEHKSAFFCLRPLLVEGISDMIVTKGLDYKCSIYLEAAGVQIIPIIGKGQMRIVTKFMRLLGKKPIVLADADAFTDSIEFIQTFHDSPEVLSRALDNGYSDFSSLSRPVYSDFCNAVRDHWESIRSLAESHSYWKPEKDGTFTEQTKRRCAFCVLMSTSEHGINSLENGDTWIKLRTRIIFLFEVLAQAGCYILRKGAIEEYYMSSEAISEGAKPTAAVAEVEYLRDLDIESVEKNYSDILMALRFAGRKVEIDETDNLKNYLISACGPIQLHLKKNELEEPTTIARRMIGNKSELFEMKLIEDKETNNHKLIVDLKSAIINAKGFPITFDKDSNIGSVIDNEIMPGE